MRVLKLFMLLFLLVVLIYIFQENNMIKFYSIKKPNDSNFIKQNDIKFKPKTKDDRMLREFTGDFTKWMGKSFTEIEKQIGEPERKDKSAYDYTWQIYNASKDEYIQFGVQNEKVVTVFATGNLLTKEPLLIGTPYKQLQKKYNFKKSIGFEIGNSEYEFKLTKEDLYERPLIQLENDLFIQLYFDTLTNELSAIRMMTNEVLLKQQQYKLIYRGKLNPSDELSNEEWEAIDKGAEQQVFDITNVVRNMYEVQKLQWDNPVSQVAYNHSKDMEEKSYFSHDDPSGFGLKERLEELNVSYTLAGENIAANYIDAPDAVIGWLNSEGHRESLLKENYTHLGVGVYHLYYTQNFIKK